MKRIGTSLLFAACSVVPACSSTTPGSPSAIGTSAAAIESASTCALASPTGAVKHVVYVQFDNLHFRRDNPNVPSDLEQMPHLLSFLVGEGTLLARHHTPLVSHTANDIATALTGLYPDRQGLAVANSYRTFASTGASQYASDFTYWTDPVSATDPAPNMVGADGKNAPAPWVAYTRAGCDFGAVGIVNMELENIAGDITTVFGAGSPQAAEARSNPAQATADFEGIAVHCARDSAMCGGDVARADVLPDEPTGYAGYKALFGHSAVAPRISGSPLVDLDGAPIADAKGHVGFPGFDGMNAKVSLGYVATMLEAGLPIVYAYISDAHDNHEGAGAYGPGAAGYVAALKEYDDAFGKFFARLTADGIDRSNTVFVFTADEGDHFVGGAPTPAGCDGVTTPCTYAQIGEVDVNVTGLLAEQGITTPLSIAQSLGVYLDGNPDPAAPSTRLVERAFATTQVTNPVTGGSEPITSYVADRTEMKLLHMITGDPLRTPTFTAFVNPNFYTATGPTACTAAAPCVQEAPAYAWNHGMVSPDVNVTWLGIVGPGVRARGVDHDVWSDHADIRPTILALTGLSDDYAHEGRALFEVLREDATPAAVRARNEDTLRLAELLKQISAPMGELAQLTLHLANDVAKSGDATSDQRFVDATAFLNDLAQRRDELANRIADALDGATFRSAPLGRAEARRMIEEAEALLFVTRVAAASL